MKKKQQQDSCIVQLDLFTVEQQMVTPDPQPTEEPESDREYLLKWGEEYHYPELSFPLPNPHQGFKYAVIPAGKEAWLKNIANPYILEWLCSARKRASEISRKG